MESLALIGIAVIVVCALAWFGIQWSSRNDRGPAPSVENRLHHREPVFRGEHAVGPRHGYAEEPVLAGGAVMADRAVVTERTVVDRTVDRDVGRTLR